MQKSAFARLPNYRDGVGVTVWCGGLILPLITQKKFQPREHDA